MRHRLNAVRRQRGFHAHGAGAGSAGASCALLRLTARTWRKIPSTCKLENGSRIAHARFICLLAATTRVRCFPQRLSSGAQEKRSAAVAWRLGPSRIAASDHLNLRSGTQPPVPRLRDRMQQRGNPHKRENACGCAYRVQGADLLCISRGKSGRSAAIAKVVHSS